jgi:hypothetical protein
MIVARTFGFDTPRAFSAYYLHRSRYGTTVYVIGGRLTMNLSHYAQTYPPNFKEARKWIAAIAERQNWTMTETTRRATIFRDQPASTADQ